MNKTYIYIALIGLLLSACSKVQPQGAANKKETSPEQMALMEMNLRLAEEAERIVVDSVKASNLPFVLEDYSGFWYCKTIQTEGDSIRLGMEVDYSASIRDLQDNKLIADISEAITIGHSEAIPAIQYVLPYMCVGEEFLIIAPYYCAFGKDGRDGVPPLTNVRIHIKANNILKK